MESCAIIKKICGHCHAFKVFSKNSALFHALQAFLVLFYQTIESNVQIMEKFVFPDFVEIYPSRKTGKIFHFAPPAGEKCPFIPISPPFVGKACPGSRLALQCTHTKRKRTADRNQAELSGQIPVIVHSSRKRRVSSDSEPHGCEG